MKLPNQVPVSLSEREKIAGKILILKIQKKHPLKGVF
jgi:hypothetical protein